MIGFLVQGWVRIKIRVGVVVVVRGFVCFIIRISCRNISCRSISSCVQQNVVLRIAVAAHDDMSWNHDLYLHQKWRFILCGYSFYDLNSSEVKNVK